MSQSSRDGHMRTGQELTTEPDETTIKSMCDRCGGQLGLLQLVEAGLFTLGWLFAKEGLNAMPVAPLAKALRDAGCDASYVRAVCEMADEKKLKDKKL